MVFLPYAPHPEAKSTSVAGARWPHALVASGWLAVSLGVAAADHRVTAARSAALVLGLTVVTALTAWRYARRAGGFTGDFLGATEQLGELVGFAVLAWGSA
jgi:adenosylcobinamide-GDP ribazoletransferase